MNINNFHASFEAMRQANLGRQFDRRELSLLARKYGTHINSTMWAAGLSRFFVTAKLGPRFVYTFKTAPVLLDDVMQFNADLYTYAHNSARKIEHAKLILRNAGIEVI